MSKFSEELDKKISDLEYNRDKICMGVISDSVYLKKRKEIISSIIELVKGIVPLPKQVRTETNKRQMKIGSNEIIDVETHIHYDKEDEAFNSCRSAILKELEE